MYKNIRKQTCFHTTMNLIVIISLQGQNNITAEAFFMIPVYCNRLKIKIDLETALSIIIAYTG